MGEYSSNRKLGVRPSRIVAVIAEKAPSGILLPNLPRVLFSSYPWEHLGHAKSLVRVLATVGRRVSESQARQYPFLNTHASLTTRALWVLLV
jgi:hypothetical protein